MTRVHLVIPAYNEGRRLPAYLPRLCEALAESSLSLAYHGRSTMDREKKTRSGCENVRARAARRSVFIGSPSTWERAAPSMRVGIWTTNRNGLDF